MTRKKTIYVMLFILALLTFNCNSNSDEFEVSLDDQAVRMETIEFDKIPHLLSIQSQLHSIDERVNSKILAKSHNLNLDGLSILTDKVIFTEYEDTHTYTFKMFRKNPETYIENIVLKYDAETGLYNEYLVQYFISFDKFVEISTTGKLNGNENVRMIALEEGIFNSGTSKGFCFNTCQTIEVPCGSDENHEVGDTSCTLIGTSDEAFTYQSCGVVCLSDPADGGEDPFLDEGGSSGGGTGVATNPNTGTPCQNNSGTGFVGSDGGCVVPTQIINEIDDPCVTEIINTVNSINNDVGEGMLEAFGGDDSFVNLTYKNGNLIQNGGTVLARTDFTSDANGVLSSITITLSNNYIATATDISIFKTVVHENIHAYMFYQLATAGITVDNPNGDLSILADEWSQYVAQRELGIPHDQTNVDLQTQQHEAMSDLVTDIGKMIKDYATSKGYDIDDFTAEALAWSGLQETVGWSLLDNEIRETYEDIIDYESTGFEILAVGEPCN